MIDGRVVTDTMEKLLKAQDIPSVTKITSAATGAIWTCRILFQFGWQKRRLGRLTLREA